MKFKKTTKIDAPVEEVWAIFAHGFDNAHEWMASVPNS
jgi:ligand-binding SRPBCC domain-containing protein